MNWVITCGLVSDWCLFDWHQSITWMNVQQCWIIAYLTIGKKNWFNLNQNRFPRENAFENVISETVGILVNPKCVDSLWPRDAIWWHGFGSMIWVNKGTGNNLLPDGTKPLPKPMLTYHQWGSVIHTWDQFHRKCSRYQLVKCFWKIQL